MLWQNIFNSANTVTVHPDSHAPLSLWNSIRRDLDALNEQFQELTSTVRTLYEDENVAQYRFQAALDFSHENPRSADSASSAENIPKTR